MQAAEKSPARPTDTPDAGQQTAGGPTPIAHELLQLIGGGKAEPAPTVKLPVAKW